MQNRFGVKDFFVILLLLVVAISIWLSMMQGTRIELVLRNVKDAQGKFETQMSQLDAKTAKLETAVAEIRERLDQGVQVAAPTAAAGTPSAGAAGSPGTTPASTPSGASTVKAPVGGVLPGDAWARPGVPIQRFPVPTPATDPTKMPGYAIGGTFTELFEAQPAKMVPYINTDTYGNRVIDRVCDSLGVFEPKTLQLVGNLAEAWQVDPDGRWLRARIHARAKFSDGHPVTADDLIYTFKTFIGNSMIEAEVVRSIMDNLSDVERIDDRSVEFKFSTGLFSNPANVLVNPVLPAHYYSRFEPTQINQSTGLLMGSGPFRMQNIPNGPQDLSNQWRPGDDVVLVRNEQYWATKPSLERLTYRAVNEEMARFVAYSNGEGDMMLPASVQFRKVLKDDPEFEKTNYALNWVNMRSGYSFIGWQCGPRAGKKLTPFADVRVRRAMTMLVDRERMIRDIYEDIGIVSKGPMNPESPASNPALKPLPYDPEGAKKLLAEAGWKDRDGDGVLENEKSERFEFEFTRAPGGATHERMTEFLKDSYAKAGIRMTVRIVDWSVYTEIMKTRDFDALTLSWSASAPESDPKQIWHSDSMKEGGHNFVQWKSPEVDALIEQGRREMDPASRQLIWQHLEQVIADGQAYTFIRALPWLRFVKRDFGNVQTYKSGLEPEEFFHISPTNLPAAN